MPRARDLAVVLTVATTAAPLAAQQPDSLQQLPELRVAVTRQAVGAGTAGFAVTLLDTAALRRGRTVPSLEEALALVPGVIVRDRGDPTQDLRLTIRGAGARANFGVRGVRVLVDGVPATLPDGQTPLSAVDLLLATDLEVARGPLASLHGNGSLGVVAIGTRARLPGRWQGRGGLTRGADATTAWHAVAGGGGERLGGVVAASGIRTDGWREHAAAEQWRLRGALEWRRTPGSIVTLRASHADDPMLESPGALTLAEVAADPLQASPNSLRRNAGKEVSQSTLSLGWDHRVSGTASLDLIAWLTRRDLANPIAAPAPAPADPEEGIWIGIDRRVAGARASVGTTLGSRMALVAGVDVQRMVDDRVNRRHRAGAVFGEPFLDQREQITELGSFAQVTADLGGNLVARAGGRHDRVAFDVTDRLDPSSGGARTMAAWSASGALAWNAGPIEAWIGIGSAFETPTTTELANRPDGGTGINTVLDPSRTVSTEVGLRWRRGTVAVEVTGWRAVTDDAITAVTELEGRSYFANVGRTRSLGVEASVTASLASRLQARATATWLDARFGDDALAADGAAIADNRLPGVVPFTAGIGLTATPGSLTITLEQVLAGGVWADDGNTQRIDGWGAGITHLHLRWQPHSRLALTGGVRNLFDVDHVAGVVVNGGFGRVAEPGRPRTVTVGGEVSIGG